MPDPTSRCVHGDITVTKIPTGYLIGRALVQNGPGPWWEYVTIFSTYEDALRQARAMAHATGRNAWLHKGGDDYEPLPDP
jgi:hypothetical protein